MLICSINHFTQHVKECSRIVVLFQTGVGFCVIGYKKLSNVLNIIVDFSCQNCKT